MLGEPGIDVASMPPMAACIANHEQASHSIFANTQIPWHRMKISPEVSPVDTRVPHNHSNCRLHDNTLPASNRVRNIPRVRSTRPYFSTPNRYRHRINVWRVQKSVVFDAAGHHPVVAAAEQSANEHAPNRQ